MNVAETVCKVCRRIVANGEVVLTVQPQVVTKQGRAVHADVAIVCTACVEVLGLTDAIASLGVSLEKE